MPRFVEIKNCLSSSRNFSYLRLNNRNIALGESEFDINKDKLFEAIELSGLSKLIETLPDGVDTDW